jgi:hypothetical protein
MLTFMRRGWAGQARLSQVFLHAVLAFVVLSLLHWLALRAANFAGLKEIRTVGVLSVMAAGMTWCIWTAVALWRCAPNVERRVWVAAARVCAVGLAAVVALTIYELVV